jgi:plastocyanin
VVAAGGAALALAACGGTSQQPPGGGVPTPAAPPSSSSPAAVDTTTIAIANFAFTPAVIRVKAGATVTWTNLDQDAHTVAISGSPVSPPLQNADTYSRTFDQPGTYSYLCTLHPTMRGMVVVTAE